jgi:hypothetical protein
MTPRTASSTPLSLGHGRASRSSGHQRLSRLYSRIFGGVRAGRTSRFCRAAADSRPLPDRGILREPRARLRPMAATSANTTPLVGDRVQASWHRAQSADHGMHRDSYGASHGSRWPVRSRPPGGELLSDCGTSAVHDTIRQHGRQGCHQLFRQYSPTYCDGVASPSAATHAKQLVDHSWGDS